MRQALYNTIGVGYNTTRQADPYLADRFLKLLLPQMDKLYLDIGCGTGNYTIKLAEQGVNFCGVDPSEEMLNKAKERSDTINWRLASSENIPIKDKCFSGAIASLTIHHWKDLNISFRELFRVLDDQGRLVIFTSLPEQTSGYWLSHYFPEMIKIGVDYLPSLEKITIALKQAGFHITATEKYFVQDDLQDLFMYSGKNKPEIYFDEQFRKGISAFAMQTDTSELNKGLHQLREDISSGQFSGVKKQYENDLGDYLFIVAEKDLEGFKNLQGLNLG